jgi:16S rRNA (uracil1498-N3)-methyltransferase
VSRFFVAKDSVKDGKIYVYGEEAHHISNVMRLKVGDSITAFDGTGSEYSGVIRSAGKRSLVIDITDTRRSKPQERPKITLMQAIPKKEKIEYIIEKATELGVDFIIPVFTGRTIPQWSAEKQSSRTTRWVKIATEAAKQCGRVDVPQISQVSDFKEAVSRIGPHGFKLIAALREGSVALKKALHGRAREEDIYIAIGPEGDFTEAEIGLALDAGFELVSLGPRVLKSDTAGLFVLSVIGYEYSD